jgi:hypothetical protein
MITSMLGLMIPVAGVLGIVALFMHLQKRNRAGWNAEEVVVADRAGAYRSSQRTVGIVERLRDIPTEVQVAGILALFFGVMWLPSLPLVGVGVAVELDGSRGGPGLATLFGTTGIPLSIAHFVLGIRFSKRDASARSLARGVAVWSIVHNVLLFAFVFAVNFGGPHVKSHETVSFEHGLGFIPLLYGCASIAYAVYALHAAKVHEVLDVEGRVDPEHAYTSAAPPILAVPGDVPPGLATAAPVPVGEAPPWP